jgi:hypothetical protein
MLASTTLEPTPQPAYGSYAPPPSYRAPVTSPSSFQPAPMPAAPLAPGYTAAFAGGPTANAASGYGLTLYAAPAVLPYRSGQPVDPLYRKESQGNFGLIVGGSLTFLGAYGAALHYGDGQSWQNGTKWLYLPVGGPFVAISKRNLECKVDELDLDMANRCADHAVGQVEAMVLLAVDGLIQTIGATLLVAGVLDRTTVLVRNDIAGLKVAPAVVAAGGSRGAGLRATGSF